MTQENTWPTLNEREIPGILAESVDDLHDLAEVMGVTVSYAEMTSILAGIYGTLGPNVKGMDPGAMRAAVRDELPGELKRLAAGHRVPDDA